MNAIGHLLDEFPKQQNDTFKGITIRRAEDKQWQKLFSEMTELEINNSDIFNDEETKKMVNNYIDYSYAGSSLLLYAQLINEFVPVDLQPTNYIASGAYKPEIDVKTRMVKLLNELDSKIRDEKMENQVQTVVCKLCSSSNTIKFGTYKDTQLHWCRSCKHKFICQLHKEELYHRITSCKEVFYEN